MDEGINLGSINSMDRDLGTNVRNVSFFVLNCEACCEVESCKVLKCAVCKYCTSTVIERKIGKKKRPGLTLQARFSVTPATTTSDQHYARPHITYASAG